MKKKKVFLIIPWQCLYTRTIPRIVRMFKMIDLMLSRKKIQKCHVALGENLNDTGAYWEQAPRNLCILLALQS